MHYCGDFRTSYEKDMEVLQTPVTKFCVVAFLAFLLVWPFLAKGEYLWISMQIAIAVVAIAAAASLAACSKPKEAAPAADAASTIRSAMSREPLWLMPHSATIRMGASPPTAWWCSWIKGMSDSFVG